MMVVLATGSVAACGSDEIELPQPARMEKVAGGDGQRATAGNRLAVPLSVLITASDSSGVPRVGVRWRVTQGNGAALSDTLSVTDGVGVARVFLTLGPTAGDYTVAGSLVDRPDAVVTFVAHAVPAPVLTQVEPATFTAGDELLLRGSFLSDSVEIEMGGVSAVVANVSISGQGMTVVAPHCLIPGPVGIVARVGISVSSPVTGTYQSSAAPIELSPGEHVSIEPAALDGCATFGAAVGELGPEEREYLMAVHSVTESLGELMEFRFTGGAVAPPLAWAAEPIRERTHAEQFHDRLRELEAELAALQREPWVAEGPAMAPQAREIKIGDRRSFRVCDKITCRLAADFATVEAEVKYVGHHAIIYQDITTPSGGFTAADLVEMGELFDAELYEVTTRAFGSESDMDRNGRVLILLTPVVNGLTEKAECEESFITGFFFPIDIDPVYANDERSNQSEIFYSMVPDPQGTVTCTHSVTRVKRLVPVTFVHELQHMINFSQHVIVRAGNSEQTWLNEAMSHVSEELAALHFEALGDRVKFNSFAINNIFNAYEYLTDPSQHFLIYRTGSGTIQERGASWLFLRWVTDQYGDGVLRRLSETKLVGTENLVAAAGAPMAKMLTNWFMANYVSDHPYLVQIPERMRYLTWDFRALYASLHEQDASTFVRPFPLEPPLFVNGAFDVTGYIRSGSGAYVSVRQLGGNPGFSLELLDGSGNLLQGVAVPRLTVIRVR